jgi:hypothetical protein
MKRWTIVAVMAIGLFPSLASAAPAERKGSALEKPIVLPEANTAALEEVSAKKKKKASSPRVDSIRPPSGHGPVISLPDDVKK